MIQGSWKEYCKTLSSGMHNKLVIVSGNDDGLSAGIKRLQYIQCHFL